MIDDEAEVMRQRQRIRGEAMAVHILGTLTPSERRHLAQSEARVMTGETDEPRRSPMALLVEMRQQPFALVCPDDVRDHVYACQFCRDQFLESHDEDEWAQSKAIAEYRRLGSPVDRLDSLGDEDERARMRGQTATMYQQIATLLAHQSG